MNPKKEAMRIKRLRQKILVGFLAALIACMPGCGKSGEDSEDKTGESGRTENSATSGKSETSGMQESSVAAVLDKEVMEAGNGAQFLRLRGNTGYYVRYEQSESGENGDSSSVPTLRILCVRQKGKKEEVIYTYEEPYERNLAMLYSSTDKSGNWYNLFKKDDEKGNTEVYLEKVNADGMVLFSEIQEEYRELLTTEHVMDGTVSEDGKFCALTWQGTLIAWNAEGQAQGRLRLWNKDEEHDGKGLADAGDAGIYYYSATETEVVLKKIDTENLALQKEEIALKLSDSGKTVNSVYAQPIQVYSGYEAGIFLGDENGLWNYVIDGEEPEFLFGWLDSHVNVKRDFVEQVSERKDGILLLTYDVFSQEMAQMLVAKVSSGELPEKKKITLANVNDWNSSNLKDFVREYNAQSSLYTLELVDYSGENTEHGMSGGGADRLTKELLKGEGPDLFVMNYLPENIYISQGILEDLAPYLEEDGIQMVESVKEALSTDEKLYAIAQEFFIRGYISLEGYSTNGGIRIEQMDKLAKAYPDSELMDYQSHLGMLENVMDADMDRYLDMQGRTCHFDSVEFVELLNLVKGWKEHKYSGQGDVAVSADGLYNHEFLMTNFLGQNMIGYLQARKAFDGFADIHGYPTWDGEPKYQVDFGLKYGMNSASDNKEGAWDFLAWLLSDENQEKYIDNQLLPFFPIVDYYFEKSLDVEMTEYERAQNIYTGEMDTGLKSTEEDKEAVRFMVEHLYYPDDIQSEIRTIIYEETQGFFASQKTAEDVAEKIQSRVSLLLNE